MMDHTLEEDYHDFLEIQGLKGSIDIPKVAVELGIDEAELFEFVNQHVARMMEAGLESQNVGESLGTLFLFGLWLRGVRGDNP